MQNNHIVIKEQQKDWLLKGFVYLGLMILSLVITFIPLFSGNDSGKMAFYIIGGLAFTAFTTLFVLLLYKVCNPGIAMILNSRGFVDKKNVGDRIVVDWTNISAIKQLGKKDMPYLGISLENTDIVLAQMKSKEADAMRENFNNNLPAILIAQNEIRMPIKDLKDLFTKYAREARALATENENSKQKVNPYSSEDVLKNFQPKTIEETPDSETPNDISDNVTPDTDNTSNETENSNVSEPVQEQVTPVIANNFYEELLKQAEIESKPEANVNVEPVVTPDLNNSDNDNDKSNPAQTIDIIPSLSDILPETESTENKEEEKTIVISEEFTDILNQARATKIMELDKILNDKEIETISDNAEIPAIQEPEIPSIDSKIGISNPEPERSEIKITDLESMIENALLNVEPQPKPKPSEPAIKIDLEPFEEKEEEEEEEIIIPEPKAPKTKKKKSFVLNEKK